MIKNAKDLNRAEKKQFALAYTMYFRNVCVVNYGEDKVKSKELLQAGAIGFSRKMIKKIENGSRVGFVNIEGDIVDGFVVGNTGQLDCAWIAHIYSETGDPITDKIVLGNLYKEFALEMKKRGMIEVVTDCEKDDPKLQERLEDLEFEVQSTEGSQISYGRSI